MKLGDLNIIKYDLNTRSIFEFFYSIKIFNIYHLKIFLGTPIIVFFLFSLHASYTIKSTPYLNFISNNKIRYKIFETINMFLYFNTVYFISLLATTFLLVFYIHKKKKFSEYENFKTSKGKEYKESDWLEYHNFIRFKINRLHFIAVLGLIYLILRLYNGKNPILSFDFEDLDVFININREIHFTYLHYIAILNKLFLYEYATSAYLYYYCTMLLLQKFSEK